MPVNTITRTQMIDFFKSGATLNVDDIAKAANAAGRPELAQAARAADDGDGKIASVDEARELFARFDKFDHNGDANSIDLRGTGLEGMFDAPSSGGGGATPTFLPVLVGASAFSKRFAGAGSIEVANRGGKTAAFQWTGKMDVDTDGGKSPLARSDRFFQANTSLQFAGHQSLNADVIPYVVLPPSLAAATGAKLGDLVQVQKGGKSLFAVYGDVGPGGKLGEGSLFLAKFFQSNAGPNIGIDAGVTYTVLPGSGAAAGIRAGGPAFDRDAIQAAGAAAFANAKAQGIVR